MLATCKRAAEEATVDEWPLQPKVGNEDDTDMDVVEVEDEVPAALAKAPVELIPRCPVVEGRYRKTAPENATYEQMRAWFERFCVFVTSVTAYVEMNKGDGIVYPSERSARRTIKT